MTAPEGEGALRTTHRAVLESLAEQGDPEAAEELAAQPPAPDADYLWAYFQDVSQSRPVNGFGPCRLPRTEIRAWEEGEGFRLAPWEVRAIVRIDEAWMVAMSERDPPKS